MLAAIATVVGTLLTLGGGIHALPEERADLLQYRDKQGRIRQVRSAGDWTARRAWILEQMQRVMGPLPGREKRVPLDVEIGREEKTAKFLRRKLSYQSAPGERVPAWLLIPVGLKGKAPAMLCLHQTTASGKDETVGISGKPNLHYGQELAERGYVVLAPDYPTLGEHQIDVYAHGWASGSMKAIWDNVRALDLLRSLPEVDPTRIGCIGHSLGGHNTLFTAAFDTRIRCAVSNCGFTAFHRYYGGKLGGWAGTRYMPRIKDQFPTPDAMPFDFQHVLGAIAPRPVLAIAPLHDDNFDVEGVRQVIAGVLPAYQLFGATDRLLAVYPDCAHDWPLEYRKQAYEWLDKWLKPTAEPARATHYRTGSRMR